MQLCCYCCSVTQSCPVLWPRGHMVPPSPSPSPKVYPSSFSLHWWCHPAISSSDILFSFCPWSFPASGTFPVSIQSWFPLRSIGLILLSKWLLGFFSSTTVQRHQFFGVLPFLMVQFSQPCVTTGKIIALTTWIFVNKVLALLFNILSRFVITFLPRSNCFLILEPKKRKSVFSVFTTLLPLFRLHITN